MNGLKFDIGKPKMSLLDPWFLMSMARNMGKGEDKYGGPENPQHWSHGLTYSRVLDAMDRHSNAIKRGEMVDPDSGEPHATAIACGAMMLNYFDRTGRSDLDDRRFKEKMPGAVPTGTADECVQSVEGAQVGLDLSEVPELCKGGGSEKTPGDVEELQARITRWADRVFPDRTAQNALQKLVMEEIPELLNGGLNDPLEYGDVLILILDVAHLRGIDAVAAAHAKMAINEKRQWLRDKDTGLMHHVEGLEPHTPDIVSDKTGVADCGGGYCGTTASGSGNAFFINDDLMMVEE